MRCVLGATGTRFVGKVSFNSSNSGTVHNVSTQAQTSIWFDAPQAGVFAYRSRFKGRNADNTGDQVSEDSGSSDNDD